MLKSCARLCERVLQPLLEGGERRISLLRRTLLRLRLVWPRVDGALRLAVTVPTEVCGLRKADALSPAAELAPPPRPDAAGCWRTAAVASRGGSPPTSNRPSRARAPAEAMRVPSSRRGGARWPAR